MNRQQKTAALEEMSDKFKRAKSCVLMDFSGLKVVDANSIRKGFRDNKVEYKVCKNTINILAVKGTEKEELQTKFTGVTGVILSYDDPVAPLKVITKFAKDYEAFKIKAGWVDGKVYDAAGIVKMSNLPSKEELLAQILSCINGPARGLVSVINAVPRALVTAVDQIRKKKEAS